VTIPDGVVSAVAGLPHVGVPDQAFVFITTDVNGFPHPCLLSRAEIACDAGCLIIVLAGQQTPANLRRSGQATFIAVAGEAAHVCKLQVVEMRPFEALSAARLRVVAYKSDSVGVPLGGMTFVPTTQITVDERWADSQAVLAAMLAAPP
jgi:hypothetical protein